jgi:HEAT repeat protein
MSDISPELQRAMNSSCATGVEEVIEARRPEDLAALRALLRDDNVPASLRQNAIHILGRWGDADSAEAVRALFPRLDERDRINALDALGRMGGPDAEDAVLALADDESPDVRRFAAYALSRLGTEAAQTQLGEMAENDPAPSVRTAASRSQRRAQ